eukprot:gene27585-7220_t
MKKLGGVSLSGFDPASTYFSTLDDPQFDSLTPPTYRFVLAARQHPDYKLSADQVAAPAMPTMKEMKATWMREQDELKKDLITEDNVDWTVPMPGAMVADSGEKDVLRLIGGVDISFSDGEPPADDCSSFDEDAKASSSGKAVAALVVMTFPGLEVVYKDFEILGSIDALDADPGSVENRRGCKLPPYVPGFLAFREVPAYMVLIERARASAFMPQLIVVDGCGTLHPSGFGSACHLGVVSGVPTVGVAKNLFAVDGIRKSDVMKSLKPLVPPGDLEGEKEESLDKNSSLGSSAVTSNEDGKLVTKGVATTSDSYVSLNVGQPSNSEKMHQFSAAAKDARCAPLVGLTSVDPLGMALCPTATCKNPIYISVGHRVGLDTAVNIILRCCNYRIPEPTRQADILSREHLRLNQ